MEMSRESSPTTGQELPFSDGAKNPSPSATESYLAAATAESHASELERLNEEIRRVATRATRLLEVTTALSEAQSVEDVTAVVLNMGIAMVEATHHFVDLFKIGRVNYLPITKTTDWKSYTERMVELCARLNVAHYVKKDLQPFLPKGYSNPLRVPQHH
jgi:putative lipase involved disintegration of autophagic bodies